MNDQYALRNMHFCENLEDTIDLLLYFIDWKRFVDGQFVTCLISGKRANKTLLQIGTRVGEQTVNN